MTYAGQSGSTIDEVSLGAIIKVLAVCLFAVVATLFATGIERIVWLFSGSGLVAVIPQKTYQKIRGIQCDKRFVEVKRDGDGMLRYRCGSYWLLSHSERSAELTNAWPDIKRKQQNGAVTP